MNVALFHNTYHGCLSGEGKLNGLTVVGDVEWVNVETRWSEPVEVIKTQ